MTIYLKTSDHDSLILKLKESEIIQEIINPEIRSNVVKINESGEEFIEEVITPSTIDLKVNPNFELDIIGVIQKETGNIIGEEPWKFPELETLPGYHANLRGCLSESQLEQLSSIIITPPTNPIRQWA